MENSAAMCVNTAPRVNTSLYVINRDDDDDDFECPTSAKDVTLSYPRTLLDCHLQLCGQIDDSYSKDSNNNNNT